MRYKGVILFLFLISISFVIAQPPFQQTTGDVGIQIESPIIEIHEANMNFHFDLHAHNLSSGLLLANDTTNCILHLYTPVDGSHIVKENMSFDPDGTDFDLEILLGNFTELGQYSVEFYCEIPGEIGGFLTYAFQTTQTGNIIDTGETIRYIFLLIFILMFLTLSIYIVVITPYGNPGEEIGGMFAITKVTGSKYIKLMAIWISYGIFMIFITTITGMINNYIQFEALRTLATNFYLYLNIIGYGVSVLIIWLTFYNIWKDIILNKTIIQEGKAFVKKL